MSRTTLALILSVAASPLLAQNGYRYHAGGYGAAPGYSAGGYEYRSYQYETYAAPSTRFVGRPGSGYYPNRTAGFHYTSPRITTGQGFVDPYRGGYGYGYVNPYRGYGYTRSGYGAAVPRYYGR